MEATIGYYEASNLVSGIRDEAERLFVCHHDYRPGVRADLSTYVSLVYHHCPSPHRIRPTAINKYNGSQFNAKETAYTHLQVPKKKNYNSAEKTQLHSWFCL